MTAPAPRRPKAQAAKRVLQFVVVGIATWFLVARIRLDSSGLATVAHPQGIGQVFPAGALVLLTLGIHACMWREVNSRLAGPLPLPRAFFVYFASALARYIPGGLWHVPARSGLAAGYGQDVGAVAVGSGIELAVTLVSAALLSVASPIAGIDWAKDQVLWILVWASVGVAVALLVFIGAATRRSWRDRTVGGIREAMHRIPANAIGGWVLGYLLAWVIQGSALLLLLSVWIPLGSVSLGVVVTSYAVAWAVGFLNPLAPGGLGTREAVLIVCLAGAVTETTTLAAALALRLLTLVGEMLWLALASAVLRRNRMTAT